MAKKIAAIWAVVGFVERDDGHLPRIVFRPFPATEKIIQELNYTIAEGFDLVKMDGTAIEVGATSDPEILDVIGETISETSARQMSLVLPTEG